MEPRDYRFYKISKEATEQIKKETDEIQAKRKRLLNEAIESVGAEGVSFSNSWGVDIRTGCCAVYQKNRTNDTTGCHRDDDRNIAIAKNLVSNVKIHY